MLEAISKIGFCFKVKADARFEPEVPRSKCPWGEYPLYFEDLNRVSNVEIGPKDFFEIASDMEVTL